MSVAFAKYEGLGNDFVLVEGPAAVALRTAANVARICDRHLGVGADGVLMVTSDGASVRMDIFNADGSNPEMCGNGLRCVALHLLRPPMPRRDSAAGSIAENAHHSAASNGNPPAEMVVQTAAGPHRCRLIETASGDAMIEVEMPSPSLLPGDIGVDARGPVVDARWEVADREITLTLVSMGNPHAVTFDDVGRDREMLGPKIETDHRFARGVNVGFARQVDDVIELAVWERGVGWTRACGTGACAAAVAAVATGRASRHATIPVILPGGRLEIVVGDPGETLMMTGPARRVFAGHIDLNGFGGPP